MTPDPSLLYLTRTHREVLAGLQYAILAEKGFTLLTGDAGTGKTTVISSLIASLPARVKVFLVVNPVLQADEFLEYVILQLGIKDFPASKAQRISILQEALQQADRNGQTLVLIIDEAHRLTAEVLEEMRLLGNFETPRKKLLQIILAGQTELCGLLNRTDLRQLKQRLAVRLSIQTLSDDEVAEYIASRWQMSGATASHPFSLEALATIARYATGTPRIINAICDNALVLMLAEGKTTVDEPLVHAVCKDLDLTGPVQTAARGEPAVPARDPATPPLPAPQEPPPETTGAAVEPMFPTPFQTLRRYEESTKRPFLVRWAARLGLSGGNA